jgi:ketosteroid isomerase-like protein
MQTKAEAEIWARAWLDTRNTHDVEAALQFYSEDVEYISPFTRRILGAHEGLIRGKVQLRDYFIDALNAFPEVVFELEGVYCGVEGVIVLYRSIQGLHAAEVMTLNEEDQVVKSVVYYR